MTHILYLAHDLDDAAIWRRIAMLERGGATVTVCGFERGKAASRAGAIVLGRTADGKMAQRVMSVLRSLPMLQKTLAGTPPPQVILARNLEMLVLARRMAQVWPEARLIYETLDIHRMMLGDGARARLLRGVERALLRKASLVLTSSPKFIREYFLPHAQTKAPIRLVENKCLEIPATETDIVLPEPGRLVIGWFGILRCAASLACLDALTRAAPGRYRVVLRGRPALDVMPRFHEAVAANPDLDFAGAYRNPQDLPSIYGAINLAWLIDRFDAGQNSDWLLPNRLYEGCAHGAVPVVLQGTETARFLADRDIGLTIDAVTPEAVAAVICGLETADLDRLRSAVRKNPAHLWTTSTQECRALVAALASAAKAPLRESIAAPGHVS